MNGMAKQQGAFLTIGELAAELGVPHHILRYWESRFPALRPLQRAGNRRYYRPEDVALARAINRLLNVEGYTVKGAQQALSARSDMLVAQEPSGLADAPQTRSVTESADLFTSAAPTLAAASLLRKLEAIREKLKVALDQPR